MVFRSLHYKIRCLVGTMERRKVSKDRKGRLDCLVRMKTLLGSVTSTFLHHYVVYNHGHQDVTLLGLLIPMTTLA